MNDTSGRNGSGSLKCVDLQSCLASRLQARLEASVTPECPIKSKTWATNSGRLIFDLSRRVLAGGEKGLDNYLPFLRGGCGKHPLDLFAGAGVDMTCREPVANTLKRFGDLTEELDQRL